MKGAGTSIRILSLWRGLFETLRRKTLDEPKDPSDIFFLGGRRSKLREPKEKALRAQKSERRGVDASPFGAADRGRTGTVLLPRDFKSLVSAYFTTAAYYTKEKPTANIENADKESKCAREGNEEREEETV